MGGQAVKAPTGYEDLFRTEHARLAASLATIDADAADAVQEAFVQAYVHWRRVRDLDDPAGWVRRVAVNRLLNVRRSKARRDAAVQRITTAPSAVDTDTRMHLADAIRELPRQQQIAVVLFYGRDLSIDSIADAMDISDGAVKYHLHEGRERLRALLLENVDD